jgi:hypothetical protein
MEIEAAQSPEPPWLTVRGRPAPEPPVVDLNAARRPELEAAGLSADGVARLFKVRRSRPIRDLDDLAALIELRPAQRRALRDRLVGAVRPEVVLLAVEVSGDRIHSDRRWSLDLRFLPPIDGRAVLAAVEVTWQGAPFVVEHEISLEESQSGAARLEMSDEFALPPGPIELTVTLYDDLGGASSRELSAWVLPSNPLSLFISARNRSIYNGSVRPDWHDPNWVTALNITLINGDATDVRLRRAVEWSFWDGGVGSGTRIEGGSFDWPSQIVVPRLGTYSGWIAFTSPPGSGIHGRYESKEDMAIHIVFTKEDGTRVDDQRTCRIMAGWGVNVIQVGSYTAAEKASIQSGLDDARDLYENFGLTFSGVQWWIIRDDRVGGYQVLDDHGEWESLLDDWTVANDSVDCFVVRGMWETYGGWSPIPGPASKDGACQDDGLAVTRFLGCLAHEFGHYIGGHNHVDDTTNLMYKNCGRRQISYDQYRAYLRHGFTRIVR